MVSLYAGPRRGICAYTKDSLEVGYTFYIAIFCEDGVFKETGIVEITEMKGDSITIRDTEDHINMWVREASDFLKTANIYTDLYGNYITPVKKKWWRFWR